MDVLLNLEHFVFALEPQTDGYVEIFGLGRGGGVVVVLHVAALKLAIEVCIDLVFHKLRVKFAHQEELAGLIDHGLGVAGLVGEQHRGDAGVGGHAFVVCTECRGDMHDARTVLGGDIVAGDDLEGLAVGAHERDELFVLDACEFFTLDFA